MKDVRNLFRLKKEIDDTIIKKKKRSFQILEAIKDRIIRDNKNSYKPVRIGNFCNNHIEYESNSDRNKLLAVEKYLNKIRPCLKYILNNLKIPDT